MRHWLRFLAWAAWDIVRHPILNIRNFRSAFRQGYELGQQGYSFDVQERAFKRHVGTFHRQPDGSWKMDE